MIDLRSDTVTRPTEAMLEAMAIAPVGDDVWGDDPSVRALEADVADRAGFAAAAFFPTATQSNLTALLVHCGRGDEYIAGQLSHIYHDEGGGAAVLGGIQPQPLCQDSLGRMALEDIAGAIKADDIHHARTRLITLENTFHGKVMPQDYISTVTGLAAERGLSSHLDGARLFNALVATGKSLAELCAGFDSVTLCFSKGLGAPVGAILLGGERFITSARRWRKTLGGGMRQSGLLAAACRYALDHHVERLADDHRHARLLGEWLARVPGISVEGQATNMVYINVPQPNCAPLEAWLAERDILVAVRPRTRMVTHLDIGEADVRRVASEIGAWCEATT
ncbi:threonine aldolase [Halomonas cupida]|uniref:Threonine aldolase n=1 Tax=Halomonas cupida TaxID=44933 RepID=A0A1M7GYH3_9GAMM|nr:low-specificity L-threonine aldolase [Halomonas cupida]GEN24789.1 threonine aldolase [Halomonas cupida]SHM21156.1 L-threonine aldolase [Halomonas cupida]